MLQQAKRAEQEGRLTEALALFESVASSRYVAVPARLEALTRGAVLRLSTDPVRRDVPKAQAMLSEAARIDPQFSMNVPASALLSFLQDVQSLRSRTDNLASALRTREREAEQASSQQDQRTIALRNENRQLREEIKTLQAELARKEDALRRTAEKLLNSPKE
jgi:chromosome segregation ATPase